MQGLLVSEGRSLKCVAKHDTVFYMFENLFAERDIISSSISSRATLAYYDLDTSTLTPTVLLLLLLPWLNEFHSIIWSWELYVLLLLPWLNEFLSIIWSWELYVLLLLPWLNEFLSIIWSWELYVYGEIEKRIDCLWGVLHRSLLLYSSWVLCSQYSRRVCDLYNKRVLFLNIFFLGFLSTRHPTSRSCSSQMNLVVSISLCIYVCNCF
jgi:hypothetical protein